ncbi:MAG: DUF1648 domain-containing protein [Parasphingorhabdus sp.]|uniref:DUF1648 domain-containing protein n=1 Tax=Parasphingorhabdus sp. TaxID=2709688 RepID=UPI0032996523
MIRFKLLFLFDSLTTHIGEMQMILTIYSIAISSAAVITGMAIHANYKLQHGERLPVHWNARFEPDNFGPRRFALFFMPILFGMILLSTALALHLIPPGPINKTSSPAESIAVITFVAMALLAVKYFYLRAIFRWAEKHK